MKKTSLSILILLFLLTSCSSEEDNSLVLLTDIKKEIKNTPGVESANIYISKTVLSPNSKIKTWWEEITSPKEESWFVFIDKHPFANWSHECEYIFISTKTGERETYKMETPPDIINEMEMIKEVPINTDGKLFDFSDIPTIPVTRSTDISNRYAVIINGGGNALSNYVRYWNDCAAIYSTLIKRYGYQKSNIELLIADGDNPAADRKLLNGTYDSSPLDLDGDGVADLQYAATSENVANTFNKLANQLTSNDELFIFVTDHGSRINNSSVIVLWGGTYLDESTLSGYLNNINAKNINIVMGQCYSGGFTNLSANNRIISTACKDTELSYACSNLLYDEFLYHWIAAANGKSPDGQHVAADYNNDGKVSMEEAFTYAQTVDAEYETPQYSSTPVSLGKQLSFSKILSPTYLNRGSKYQFKLDNGQTATWSIVQSPNSNITINSSTGLFTNNAVTYTGQCMIKAVAQGKTYYKCIDIKGEYFTGYLTNFMSETGPWAYAPYLYQSSFGHGNYNTPLRIHIDQKNIHTANPNWILTRNNGLRLYPGSWYVDVKVDQVSGYRGSGIILLEINTNNGIIEHLFYIN